METGCNDNSSNHHNHSNSNSSNSHRNSVASLRNIANDIHMDVYLYWLELRWCDVKVKTLTVTKYWSFILIYVFKQYLCWCDFAQSTTNQAPTSIGEAPMTHVRGLM